MCIYVIKSNETVIYVGKTVRDFITRVREHQRNFHQFVDGKYKGSQDKLYQRIFDEKSKGRNVKCEILIDAAALSTYGHELNDFDLQTMELGFITYFNEICPLANIEGVDKPYKWR